MARTAIGVAVSLLVFGCGRKPPADVQATIDAQHDAAVATAVAAAAVCPSVKATAPFQADPARGPAPASPAKGSSLESDAKVQDVFISCSWPDPRGRGEVWGGTSLSSLKGTGHVPDRAVTTPDEIASDTCKKAPTDCERVVVPSRHSKSDRSADLIVVRPTSDGGKVEVTVVIVVP